jgi:hypothetical protein
MLRKAEQIALLKEMAERQLFLQGLQARNIKRAGN